jgi:NAD(P)-dependent dehydrogenase (short-subunit alcohol dehydrogenase family)
MWTKENIPDQSGKIAIVTGGNTGIGFETAVALCSAGAHVIIAGRDSKKVSEAVHKINAQEVKGIAEGDVLDLASLEAIKRFAMRINARYEGIDILINNAGVMIPPESKTREGYELQFGVNFLGHFALTGHLYSLLKNRPGARVVTLSSGAHKFATHVDFENLQLEHSYEAYREYAISKLADLQFTIEFQRRLNYSDINMISAGAHPGVTETQLSRHMPEADYKAALEQFKELMPAWQGALPSLFAATSPTVNGGDYYGPDGENELHGYPALAQISEAANDIAFGRRLWEYAEAVTGLKYPF